VNRGGIVTIAGYMPKPVFDTLLETLTHYKTVTNADNPDEVIQRWLHHCFTKTSINLPAFAVKDYSICLHFLYSYRGSRDTFNAYRRDIDRLLQWSWFVREQSILNHKRDDIEAFIAFCMKPYKRWIGIHNVARFLHKDGLKTPNPTWRPFEASLSKKAIKAGEIPTKADYTFSQKALKATFAILGSFYNYCLQEEITSMNPVALIRQKSKFIRQEIKTPVIRRLSDKQWQTVITLAKQWAEKDTKHERTVFILSCLYSLYLRISELVVNERWTPTMGDFFKDSEGNWWFKTVGKGNKARQIAVSDALLAALKHYRTTYLTLSPYPALDEKTPLIGHIHNDNKSIKDESAIRRLLQTCFDAAAEKLNVTDPEEAEALYRATVHWLRHTGISDDVKSRPREHVRDDAGHSSGAITDRYIDVALKERAKSAKKKPITQDKKDVV